MNWQWGKDILGLWLSSETVTCRRDREKKRTDRSFTYHTQGSRKGTDREKECKGGTEECWQKYRQYLTLPSQCFHVNSLICQIYKMLQSSLPSTTSPTPIPLPPPQPCLTLEDVWHSAVWPSKRVLWFHMHCRQRCHSQGACSDLKHCALEMFLPPRPALAEDCQHRAMFSSQCWGQGVWIKMGWSKEENKEQKNGLLGKHTYMQACTHADASTHTHTHKHNNNNQTCKHIHTHSWTNTHII